MSEPISIGYTLGEERGEAVKLLPKPMSEGKLMMWPDMRRNLVWHGCRCPGCKPEEHAAEVVAKWGGLCWYGRHRSGEVWTGEGWEPNPMIALKAEYERLDREEPQLMPGGNPGHLPHDPQHLQPLYRLERDDLSEPFNITAIRREVGDAEKS